LPLITLETVALDTPASRATSLILAIRNSLLVNRFPLKC
jgi:hypothetical protein